MGFAGQNSNVVQQKLAQLVPLRRNYDVQEPQEGYHPFCCGKVVIKQREIVFLLCYRYKTTLLWTLVLVYSHSDCNSRSSHQDDLQVLLLRPILIRGAPPAAPPPNTTSHHHSPTAAGKPPPQRHRHCHHHHHHYYQKAVITANPRT